MFATSLIRSSKRSSFIAASALLTALLATSFVVFGGATPASAAACDAGIAEPTINDDRDTFSIGTAAELIALSENFLFEGDPVWGEGFRFEQTADIDLAGCDWSPIGTADSPFVGVYDGQGFTVSGLKISSTTASDVGFFGFVGDESFIQELTVIGEIDIPLGSIAGGSTVGGIVGYIAGETYLSQVVAEVDISIRTAAGSGHIGGLAGQVEYGDIQYSGHRGDFIVTGNKLVGGLVGKATDNIELKSNYSIATFDVTGLSGYDSAGIFGDGCGGSPVVIHNYSVGSGQHWGVAREDCGTYQDAIYNNTTFLGVASSDEDSLVGVKSESTLRMKKANTYDQWGWTIIEGWQEFDRFSVPTQIWGICSQVNDGYPYLLWEYSASPCASAPGPGSGSSSSEAEQLSAPLIKLQAHITAASRGKAAQLIGKVAGKDILFAPNSVKLSSLAKRTLRQSARLATASGSRVAVTGFAALSSQGSKHEKSVAQRRALAVAKYLRAQGVKTDIYYFGLSGRASMAFAGEPRRVEIRTLKN